MVEVACLEIRKHEPNVVIIEEDGAVQSPLVFGVVVGIVEIESSAVVGPIIVEFDPVDVIVLAKKQK